MMTSPDKLDRGSSPGSIHSTGTPTNEQSTMPSSQQGTPKSRKRVEWLLPEDPSDIDPPTSSDESPRDATEEELRSGIYQIFAQTPPGPPHLTSLAPSMERQGPVKSALRTSGQATPVTTGSPNTSPVVMEDHHKKSHSAASAQRRADDIAATELTAPPTHPRVTSKKSGKSKKRQDHYRHPHRHNNPMSTLYDLFHRNETLGSGHMTPEEEHEDYAPAPSHYRIGGLSAMKLLNNLGGSPRSWQSSPGGSGISTPQNSSSPDTRSNDAGSRTSLAGLVQSSSSQLGAIAGQDISKHLLENTRVLPQPRREKLPRSSSGGHLDYLHSLLPGHHNDSHHRIKQHVQETHSRHKYLLTLCKAFMEYGAPTHRLEEYMKMSSRVLETEAQFLYIPGCMFVSFDDSRTNTTQVKLVRSPHSINLGKLRDAHEVYKEVIHDIIGVEEAIRRLDEIMARAARFKPWELVIFYGLASACVGPYAFSARLIDLPIIFVLGAILGIMQLVIAPLSGQYSNVFEILAVIITSFLARAAGSIRGGSVFCFSSMAQSSIALILPGYTVLRGSLELQSRCMVAGSVRLVYAIIYSLFLGFGLTIGTAIYGEIDHNATSETVCREPMPQYWFFFFVPAFAFCLTVINQAHWKQMPVMILIAFAGWLVNFFSAIRFIGNTQIASALGAFAVAFMANTYGRVGMRLDRPLENFSKWVKANTCYSKRAMLPSERVASPTPSTLEKQVESSETTKLLPSLISRLLRRAPTPTPSRGDNAVSSDDTPEAKKAADDLQKDNSKRIRINYSLAAAAMLPAIFVQVPGGLAVSGSLVAGINSANQITRNTTGTSTLTAGDVTAGNIGSNIVFTVGYSVVQVAIGITVGIFLAGIVVYPFGTKAGGKWGSGKNLRSGVLSY